MTDAVLRCPKCGAEMVGFHHTGIMVAECPACHGVFLGRAELERLLGRSPAGTVTGYAGAPPYEGRHRRP